MMEPMMFPIIKNRDLDVIEVDTTDLEIDDTSEVIEVAPWAPSDDGMIYDIVDEPLLPDIVKGW